MAGRRPFALVYDSEVKTQPASNRSQVLRPDKKSRNRKPVQRPVAFEATWELRFGPVNRFRVFYAVSHERREVQVLAIGIKERNRLIIGREEIKL